MEMRELSHVNPGLHSVDNDIEANRTDENFQPFRRARLRNTEANLIFEQKTLCQIMKEQIKDTNDIIVCTTLGTYIGAGVAAFLDYKFNDGSDPSEIISRNTYSILACGGCLVGFTFGLFTSLLSSPQSLAAPGIDESQHINEEDFQAILEKVKADSLIGIENSGFEEDAENATQANASPILSFSTSDEISSECEPGLPMVVVHNSNH